MSIRKARLSLTNSSDIKALLFEHDEIMKNLFKKYFQKNKIEFKSASNFKDFL
jgi:hypothetical protein